MYDVAVIGAGVVGAMVARTLSRYNLKVCMPFGLNTIVIPSAAGKDTTVAAGLAVVSHLLSCITIPIVFMVM